MNCGPSDKQNNVFILFVVLCINFYKLACYVSRTGRDYTVTKLGRLLQDVCSYVIRISPSVG